MPDKQSEVLVKDIMSSRPIQVDADDPISLVVSLFERAHISGAPVTDEHGDYCGVISKTDLTGSRFFKLMQQKGYDKLLARDVMTPNTPIMVKEDAPVRKAIELMLDKQVHRVFVKDNTDTIIGVVSSFDVMRVIELPAAGTGGGKGKAAAEDKSPGKDRELRFFSLVSQKQEEMMPGKRP